MATELCLCGCGKIPPVAIESRPARGWVRGERMPYYPHHSKNMWPVSDGVSKVCRKCLATKPLIEFSANRRNADGKQAKCKSCSKEQVYAYRLSDGGKVSVVASRMRGALSKYRLTQADYDRMLLEQDGVCKICLKSETSTMNGKVRRLSVDHCHATGRVRGLLCAHCNHAIGKLGDDPAMLRAAARYLEEVR